MSPDFILYILIGAAILSALISQKLTTVTTGPTGAQVATTLLRIAVVGLWVWFAVTTGYWQIAVLLGVTSAISLAGILAKESAA